MVDLRLNLKTGVRPADALATLRALISEGDAVTVAAGGPSAAPAVRKAYIRWVESVEVQLAHLTHDRDVIDMLYTDRYWRISAIHESVARPIPMVTAERDLQRGALTRLAEDLESRLQRLAAAPGQIAILDTNVLLHYQEPNKIRWHDALGAGTWRLVIPLRVVEELDAKKYSGSAKLAQRARTLLPLLEQLIGDDGSPRRLQDQVTIEVPVEPGPRSRPADADEEILAACGELEQLTNSPVTLVTADTGMRLRARAQGTHVKKLPGKYLRVRDGDD